MSDRKDLVKASRRHGVLARRELRGSPDPDVRRGRLIVMHRGIYVAAGAPRTWEQSVMAAVLAAGEGAAAGRRTAARLWHLEGLDEGTAMEILVPHARRPVRSDVLVYRSRTVRRGDIVRLGNISVTSPTRTLLDLTAVLPADLMEDALDDALRRDLTSARKILVRIRSEPSRGRRGIASLRALAESRTDGRIPGSRRENELRRILESAGLRPERQVEVRDSTGAFVARVDLGFPGVRLGIEYEGSEAHTGRRRVAAGQRRGRKLFLAGWVVLYFSKDDVQQRPDEVVAEVREALRIRGSGDG